MGRQSALLILAFGLFLRLILVDTSYVFWDEAVYMLNARELVGDAGYDELDSRPILLPLLLAFTQSEILGRLLMVVLNSMLVYVIYLIASRHSHKAGLIAGLITVLFPLHVIMSDWLMTDSLAVLFTASAFYLFNKRSRKDVLSAGLMLGLAASTKFTSLIFLPMLLLSTRRLKWSLIGLLTGLLPTFSAGFIFTGTPFGIMTTGFTDINIEHPVGPLFIILSILYFGSILWIPAIMSIKNRYLTAWLCLGLLQFAWVVGKNIAVPESMLWEPMRFLLPILPPLTVLASFSLARFRWEIVAAVLVVFLITQAPLIQVAVTKSIDLEDGLRIVTKKAGENLEADEFHCTGNCPSIAYYSGAEMHFVWDEAPQQGTFVRFDCENPDYESGQHSVCVDVS